MQTQGNQDESSLLRDLRRGSVAAFETLFKQRWEPLYRIAKAKLHSHEEAEEVIQNIFSTLWEKRETLLITNLSYYLHAALRNRILNIIRDRIPQQKYWQYYKVNFALEHEHTEEIVAFQDLNTAVESAVEHLPEKSRMVFKMSRIEGRSNAEIAQILKVSEKAIEYHLTKSLKELRMHLRDYIT